MLVDQLYEFQDDIYIYTCTVIYKFTFDYLYDPSYFFFTYVRKIKLKDEKNLVTIHASDP